MVQQNVGQGAQMGHPLQGLASQEAHVVQSLFLYQGLDPWSVQSISSEHELDFRHMRQALCRLDNGIQRLGQPHVAPEKHVKTPLHPHLRSEGSVGRHRPKDGLVGPIGNHVDLVGGNTLTHQVLLIPW